ncbi:unnamed protein product [Amoebophrya sp. A25]|nr:unnamed protein product [Amoebophrya sp. A25]|eukprot:GSA25T00002721001.1
MWLLFVRQEKDKEHLLHFHQLRLKQVQLVSHAHRLLAIVLLLVRTETTSKQQARELLHGEVAGQQRGLGVPQQHLKRMFLTRLRKAQAVRSIVKSIGRRVVASGIASTLNSSPHGTRMTSDKDPSPSWPILFPVASNLSEKNASTACRLQMKMSNI